MSERDGIRHVYKFPPAPMAPGLSYCSKTLWRYDKPMDLETAKILEDGSGSRIPCKKCMEAYNKESNEGGK